MRDRAGVMLAPPHGCAVFLSRPSNLAALSCGKRRAGDRGSPPRAVFVCFFWPYLAHCLGRRPSRLYLRPCQGRKPFAKEVRQRPATVASDSRAPAPETS